MGGGKFMMSFEYPYLILLILLPLLILKFLTPVKTKDNQALRVPFLEDIKNIQNIKGGLFYSAKKTNFSYPLLWLWLIYGMVVLALMKPVYISEPIPLRDEGRDIMLVTDISTSMLEDDFVYQAKRLERIEAVRAVVADFVQKRTHDRLGLILFGTRAYEQVPLTFDKKALLDILSMMQAGMAGQSTSIGDAVALALKSLKTSRTQKEKQVIVLLTDGENNDGNISFPKAIKMAKNEGIKVYTVGLGAPQLSLVKNLFGIEDSGLDEQSLKELAEETRGRYFKVTNLSELINVYREIDKLETEHFEENFQYTKREMYFVPLLIAFLVAVIGCLFDVVLRRRQ